ncbi:MAG: MFS transporter [Candidatus Brocadiia bacterium]
MADPDERQERPPHFRWNYAAHAADGWFVGGGMAFVNSGTVLPTLVTALGGTEWLISLVPLVSRAGYLLAPLLTAHRFDLRERYMPVVRVFGVLLRLPYIVAALVLLFFGARRPGLALCAVLAAPLLAGTSWGLGSNAWWQLVVHTIPETRRASLMALRAAGTGVFGLAAGWGVRRILDLYPGTAGYAVLYLAASIMMAVSYLVFLTIRERPRPEHRDAERPTLVENLRSIPAILRADRQFALFLGTTALLNGVLIVAPFLPVYAIRRLGVADSYVGELVIFQTGGMLAGNLLLGWVGDRWGGKCLMVISRLGYVALAGLAFVAATEWGFRLVFFIGGVAGCAWMLGQGVLALEICPDDRRSTYLALVALCQMPGMLAAYLISSALGDIEGGFRARLIVAAAFVLASLVLLLFLREPRKARPDSRNSA